VARKIKPKRSRGAKRGHVIEHPSGAVLTISLVCGRRFFFCAQIPEIAARFDGAGDDEVCEAIDEFERLAAARARQRPGAP